ncbi:MAG: hypothetical protein IKB91_04425 [Anaerotignum sp.]|nr:hypothetical protein [Anaerotignum sp.]
MNYIWINPVTANMYDPTALQDYLASHGFIMVEASAHWLETVKEKYKRATETTEHTIIDMRCPRIIDLVNAYELTEQVTIPDIEPILIHCGRELSEREDLRGHEKIITTPCQSLADLGNSLGLPKTTFLPWNQFLSAHGGELAAVPPKESPIPPGFFDELNCKKISVTGREAICDLFENFGPEEYTLIELLYCKEGCHNGDGIENNK